ncbi:MAG: hypothetical protein ACK4OO_02110 [bacterium]
MKEECKHLIIRQLGGYLGILALWGFGSFSGCQRWGGYVHNSENFSLKVIFPPRWEVIDRSDDHQDLLEAYRSDIEKAKIVIHARPTAPDIQPNEIYPPFQAGDGDQFTLDEFEVDQRGSIKCANGEGRYITAEWLGPDKKRRKDYRAIFIGEKYLIKVKATLLLEDYPLNENDIIKMIQKLKL